MGPERVRRCLRGLAATGVKFAYDACAALEISHKTLREWVEAGTEFVTDEYVMMEQARKPLPRTRYADRIRPVLELAGYEIFSPPAGYWTVNEALAQ